MLKLSPEGCTARRERLIRSANADLICISNPRHIFYLSGLHLPQLELSAWGPNFLLINGNTGHTRLIVHHFLANAAKTAHVDEVEVWTYYDTIQNPGVEVYESAIQELNIRLKQYNAMRMAVETAWMPIAAEVSNLVDINAALLTMRRNKYPDELALIREAIAITEAGHRAGRAIIKPGITELDIYNEIHAAMVNEFGSAVHLMGDFVSGDRAYAVGGIATARTLQAGELVILDLTPIINGYRADFTATIAVAGQLTAPQELLQTALHAALESGEQLLKPGNRTSMVFEAVRSTLETYGLAEGIRHHGGHGLGLDHPEAPYIVPNSEEVLEAGTVVTLEPGSYGSDFGARVEHNYLITEDGFERLTHHQTSFT